MDTAEFMQTIINNMTIKKPQILQPLIKKKKKNLIKYKFFYKGRNIKKIII